MGFRILRHFAFWFIFVMLYAVTKTLLAIEYMTNYSTLEKLSRFFLAELAFFPWKIIPFYFLSYFLVPKYFRKGKYFLFGLYFIIIIIICLFAHRSLIPSMNMMVYGNVPDFNVYSLERVLYTLMDILPAIGLAMSVKQLKGSITAQQKEQALKKEKLESELNFLKAQTNPHFLFNTLNNLYGLARRNDKNTAPSIMKLSNIMRYILYECNAPTIPIESEVKIIEDYIQLELLRYDDRLKVNFDQSVEDWQQEVAPLILLPFVENAFKHGASETRFDTFIDIHLQLSTQQLEFTIKNSRENSEETSLVEGIGLKNVQRQLDLVYGKNYSLEINPDDNVFFVKLLINLKHHDR